MSTPRSSNDQCAATDSIRSFAQKVVRQSGSITMLATKFVKRFVGMRRAPATPSAVGWQSIFPVVIGYKLRQSLLMARRSVMSANRASTYAPCCRPIQSRARVICVTTSRINVERSQSKSYPELEKRTSFSARRWRNLVCGCRNRRLVTWVSRNM
jgi:hypothetical protein